MPRFNQDDYYEPGVDPRTTGPNVTGPGIAPGEPAPGGGIPVPEELGAGDVPAPGGKRQKNFRDRKTIMVNGVEYTRDGSRAFPTADVEAAGGDFNKLDPASSISWVGAKSKAVRQRKQAGWRENGTAPNPSGAGALSGMAGFKQARSLGFNLSAIDPGEAAEGGDKDLAWYILNGHLSVAKRPDGSWALINTGQSPSDPNAQWYDAQTGAVMPPSGLPAPPGTGGVDPNVRIQPGVDPNVRPQPKPIFSTAQDPNVRPPSMPNPRPLVPPVIAPPPPPQAPADPTTKPKVGGFAPPPAPTQDYGKSFALPMGGVGAGMGIKTPTTPTMPKMRGLLG